MKYLSIYICYLKHLYAYILYVATYIIFKYIMWPHIYLYLFIHCMITCPFGVHVHTIPSVLLWCTIDGVHVKLHVCMYAFICYRHTLMYGHMYVCHVCHVYVWYHGSKLPFTLHTCVHEASHVCTHVCTHDVLHVYTTTTVFTTSVRNRSL